MHHHASNATSSPLEFLRDHWWRRLVAATFVSALVLGTIGNLQYQAHEGHHAAWGNALYHTTQLFLLHTPHYDEAVPWALELARWLAAATTLALVASVAGRFLREEITLARLHRARGHAIVCGLGERGMAIVRHLRKQGRKVVVIDKAVAPELLRECSRLNVPVVLDDATHPAALTEAGLRRARDLYAVCHDDATNSEIAARARGLRPEGSGKARLDGLTCHVHLGDIDLRDALQQSLESGGCDSETLVRCIDIFDRRARGLITQELPLDRDGVSETDPRQVHLVLMGFGRMGRRLAVRAAQLGVFANGRKLKISVIDRKARTHEDALLFRHPRISEVCDLAFHSLDVSSPQAWRLLETWCRNASLLTSLVACFDDEARAVELAVRLRPLVEETRSRLAVRLRQDGGLARLIQTGDGVQSSLVSAVDLEHDWPNLLDEPSDPYEQLARSIHAEYVRKIAVEPGTALLSDGDVFKRWFAQPEDLRDSCRQQAAHIFIKLRTIGLEAVSQADDSPAAAPDIPADQVEALSRLEHNRWVAERLVANWRHAPGEKDVVRRTNPNLVPWEDLSEDIREYDREFVRAIPRVLAAARFRIMPKAPPR